MLDAFEDRSQSGMCIDGTNLQFFEGGLNGKIAKNPRGENGYGWDKIFEPEGYEGKTRAELTPDGDAATYATIKPFAALREFLNK